MRRVFSVFVLMLFAAVLIAGCAQPVKKCVSPEDNPAHHYIQGMTLMEKGNLQDAEAKFQRALYCEEGFSPAHAGLAMQGAIKAVGIKEQAHRKVEIQKAEGHLEAAEKYANTPEDEFAHNLAAMRFYAALKPNNKWLKEVEAAYSDAMKLRLDERRLLYYDGTEAASYYMGAAYLEAREFQKARDSWGAVLNAKKDGKWNAPAEAMWKKTDSIVRALSGITVGDVGKDIALKDSVSRGDMAALLIDELKIDRLLAGRIPARSVSDALRPDFIPADMLNHQFKEEVLTLMKWNLRGLEPVYDQTTKAYLFKPEDAVSRKELSLSLEDALIKITGDDSLATAYIGHDKSPFPDIPATSAWYNAAMNMTTRGIMEPELSGEFRPNDLVTGAEAVLSIRVLRQRLNIN